MQKNTYENLYNIGVIEQLTVPLANYTATEKERQVSKVSGAEQGIIYENIEDLKELDINMKAKQISHLKSIKNSMLFFVILTIIELICTFILIAAIK